MIVRVGTFNLNNLFSRFNFQAEIGQSPGADPGGITLTFDQDTFRVRTFMGRLGRAKSPGDTAEIARRIRQVVNADVLAVQEVEHIEILKQFNREHLHSLYSHIALVEGNDQRLIDVGIMSKFPIGTIVSHQTAVHPEEPNRRVFSRDLLQVAEINCLRFITPCLLPARMDGSAAVDNRRIFVLTRGVSGVEKCELGFGEKLLEFLALIGAQLLFPLLSRANARKS